MLWACLASLLRKRLAQIFAATGDACDKSRSCPQISSGPQVRHYSPLRLPLSVSPIFHAIEHLEYDNTLERISSTDLVECERIPR